MTENEAINLVISIASNQVGYHEKASNSDLDDPKANAGNKNYTAFARDMDAISGFYNGHKQGVAWCDLFVDWCFVQAFGPEIGRKIVRQPKKSSGAGCTSSATYYKNANAFYSDPQKGDQIFFYASNGNGYGHTGIVEKITSSKVYTIEGNSDDQVTRRTYNLSDPKIGGYGRPNWELAITEDKKMPIYQATVLAETGKTVYLRNTPSQKGKVVEAIPIGTVVDVIEEVDPNWSKISDGGVEGFMMRKFLFKVDIDSVQDEDAVTISQATIEAIYGHAVSIIELLKEVGLG